MTRRTAGVGQNVVVVGIDVGEKELIATLAGFD